MKFIWNLIVLAILVATLVFGGPVLTTIATAYYWVVAVVLTIVIVVGVPFMGQKEKDKLSKNIKLGSLFWHVSFLTVFAFLGWTYLVALKIILVFIIVGAYISFKSKESV